MNLLLFTIMPTITLIAQMIFTYSILVRRYSIKIHILLWGLSIFVTYGGYLLMAYFGVQNNFYYYTLSIIYVLVCIILFQGATTKKLALYCAFWQLASFLSTLCFSFAGCTVNGKTDQIVLSNFLYLLCYLILLPIYLLKFRKFLISYMMILKNGNRGFTFYPVLIFLLFTALFGPGSMMLSSKNFINMLLFESIVFFAYYLSLSQYAAIQNQTQTEEQLLASEKMLLVQKKYYEQVEENMIQQRQMMHDMRHQLVVLNEMCKDQDYDALESYVSDLLIRNGSTYTRRFCKNVAINAILNGYITIAEQKGIAVTMDIDFPEEMYINRYDICTVLGNGLENAIEACQRINDNDELYTKRSIHLRSAIKNERLIIRIENTCKEEPMTKKGFVLSSKGTLGGVGLQSVRSIIEHYHGNMSMEYKDNLFILIIFMCIDKTKSSSLD
ncbi:MAG: GHKL domain-containing protein [Mobilitalea sp.]